MCGESPPEKSGRRFQVFHRLALPQAKGQAMTLDVLPRFSSRGDLDPMGAPILRMPLDRHPKPSRKSGTPIDLDRKHSPKSRRRLDRDRGPSPESRKPLDRDPKPSPKSGLPSDRDPKPSRKSGKPTPFLRGPIIIVQTSFHPWPCPEAGHGWRSNLNPYRSPYAQP